MKKTKFLALLLVFCLALPTFAITGLADEAESEKYTYDHDAWYNGSCYITFERYDSYYDGYWYQYEYSYDFENGICTGTYTNSNGVNDVTEDKI